MLTTNCTRRYIMGTIEISGLTAGIIAIIAGLIVIIWPKIIAWIVGSYLIIVGGLAVWAALA